MLNSVHRLGRHQVSAKPNINVGYSELPLITQAHFPELIGHLEPGKMLDVCQPSTKTGSTKTRSTTIRAAVETLLTSIGKIISARYLTVMMILTELCYKTLETI